MASPQIENGYTKIANEIYEAFAGIRIAGESRQCLDLIIRKTYGFNKKEDVIALSQFCIFTKMSKARVCQALNKLAVMNLIITEKGNGKGNIYRFNKDFDTWKPLPKKEIITEKGNRHYRKRKSSLPKIGHTKETITKEILSLRDKKNMKYNENQHSDSYEEVLDADTGEKIQPQPKTRLDLKYRELLNWAEERRGKKFINILKQYKAMKILREAGISPSKIKAKWVDLDNDDYWRSKGFDFMTLISQFDKK